MTRRLCVIGNSHIVALHDALREDAGRWPDLSAEFLGFRGSAIHATEIRDGVIHPTDPETRRQMKRLNGSDSADLRGYDAYVVVGLNLRPLSVLHFSRRAVWSPLPSLALAEDIATMSRLLVSGTAARATMFSAMLQTGALCLTRALGEVTRRPILVLGQPRLSAGARFSAVPRFAGHGRAIRDGDAPHLDALYEETAATAAAASGGRYIGQPRDTVLENLLSRPKFMVESRDKSDVTHANARFGARMLDRIEESLAA